MTRGILGVVAGGLLWMIAFFVLARALVFAWPDYAVQARIYMSTGAFTFTPPMAVFNLVFWILAEILAGWLTVIIARRREPLWVLASLLVAYLALMHLILYWSRFPGWYNLAVVLPAMPAVLFGGRLAGAWSNPRHAAAVGNAATS
jgi:hypothetical protein